MTRPNRFRLAHWLQDRVIRALIWLLLCLPYRWRVPACGWVMSRIIAPLAGYRRRIRRNLALILPDLPQAEVQRLCLAVPDNVGRTIIEMYSGAEFVTQARRQPLTGAGLAVLEAAKRNHRPVILVTGHFGNYDACRAALIAQGYPLGGLYRPMKNLHFNGHYVRAIERIGKPLFPRGREGLAGMIRHLRSGGMLGIVIDQHMRAGADLTFFGHPAKTALSAAEMGLKFDAAVIPVYAIRRNDGISFDLVIEAPIPSGSPAQMTQALNNSLEAQVRAHMDQWFWIHNRWK
jgi:Kdo2-lipid IVA lauroyltransferase/acyltransferase